MSSVSLSMPNTQSRNKPDETTVSSSLSSLVDTKDRRAYEHVRSKVKKAADTVKMRAQKKSPPRPKSTPDKKPAPRKGGGVLSDDNDDGFDAVFVDNVNRGDLQERLLPSKVDVQLVDLMTTTRKRHKRADSDFEFIPHVRSVIVLDEVATREVSVDEPWEHIYGEDDTDTKNVPTYATVLSSK